MDMVAVDTAAEVTAVATDVPVMAVQVGPATVVDILVAPTVELGPVAGMAVDTPADTLVAAMPEASAAVMQVVAVMPAVVDMAAADIGNPPQL